VDFDDRELGAALRLVVGRLARQLRRHAGGAMTPSQFSALATVDRDGPIRLAALAEREGVSPPTLSRIVAQLEQDAYVERHADPADGRSSLMAVTPAGRAALRAIRRERTALLARGLAALDGGERRAVAAALPALEHLVEEVRRTAAGAPVGQGA
jgi:DNA-binding MarR family transcriptional regulator